MGFARIPKMPKMRSGCSALARYKLGLAHLLTVKQYLMSGWYFRKQKMLTDTNRRIREYEMLIDIEYLKLKIIAFEKAFDVIREKLL